AAILDAVELAPAPYRRGECPMDVVDNTQSVLTFFAALARGDFAAAKAALAADVTWWMPSMWQTSGVSKSSDAIFDECVDYTSIEVRRAFGEGDYVAVEWVARGASPQGTQSGNYYPDFSVVLFRPNFMLASEEYPMKAHKNQWLLTMLSPPAIP